MRWILEHLQRAWLGAQTSLSPLELAKGNLFYLHPQKNSLRFCFLTYWDSRRKCHHISNASHDLKCRMPDLWVWLQGRSCLLPKTSSGSLGGWGGEPHSR